MYVTLDEADPLHSGPPVVANAGQEALFADPRQGHALRYKFPVLSESDYTRVAGTPTFHVRVTPTGPGGQLFAKLYDAKTGLRLGRAVMDFRYREGGSERQQVVPGETITAKMQFQVLDVVLPPGHGLELRVTNTGMGYMDPAVDAPVRVHPTEESTLTLPVVEPRAGDYFLPPGQADVLGDGVSDDLQGNATDEGRALRDR